MRKLIMWNLVTIDGYFEGRKPWEIDWHEYVWGPVLERYALEQSKHVGLLVFGRVTYEGMAGYWPTEKGAIADFMNNTPKVVFSRTLKSADWKNTRLVREDAASEVPRLKRQPGKDLILFGSANLSATLTENGLIDEYRLALVPVVLGGGAPLFKASPERLRMRLLEAKPLKSGCVILRYAPDTGKRAGAKSRSRA